MAMAGAISGAHAGTRGIPGHLLAMLENDALGKDEIAMLGEQLFAAHISRGGAAVGDPG